MKAGEDLVAIVDRAPPGSTICIGPGTFDLGTASIVPKHGMRIAGAPIERGAGGTLEAATFLRSKALRGVVFFANEASGVVIENLDISGSPGVKDELDKSTKLHGRGINGNRGNAGQLTVRDCSIHDNASSGINGAGIGLLVVGCELHRNGSESYLGCCSGGLKAAGPATIRDCYVHDNVGIGIWQDVCGTEFVVERNRVLRNTWAGIRYEHGRDCPGWARISHNVVRDNNTAGHRAHGGIEINSAPGAEVAFNELGGNQRAGIRIDGMRGPLTGTIVHDNLLNGDVLWGCDREGVTCRDAPR